MVKYRSDLIQIFLNIANGDLPPLSAYEQELRFPPKYECRHPKCQLNLYSILQKDGAILVAKAPCACCFHRDCLEDWIADYENAKHYKCPHSHCGKVLLSPADTYAELSAAKKQLKRDLKAGKYEGNEKEDKEALLQEIRRYCELELQHCLEYLNERYSRP